MQSYYHDPCWLIPAFLAALSPVGNDLMALSGTVTGVVLVLAVMVVPGSSLEIAVPSPVFIIVLRALFSDSVSGKRVPITIDCEVGVFSVIRRGTSRTNGHFGKVPPS